jgi:hypothetical protein
MPHERVRSLVNEFMCPHETRPQAPLLPERPHRGIGPERKATFMADAGPKKPRPGGLRATRTVK